MPSDNAGESKKNKSKKVNLSEIKDDLVKRGKPPYSNEELKNDILSLDPTDPDDAIFWHEATVNPKSDSLQADKMRHRNRAESIAEQLGVAIQVNWLTDGRMVISRKANA